MRVKRLARLLLAAALLAPPPAAASGPAHELPAEPVWRHRTELRLGDQPWRAVGIYSPDAAFGPSAQVCRAAASWPELRRHQMQVLDHAQQVGAHVVKVLAYQQGLGPHSRDYRALDQLVALAAERDLRLLLVLETHDGDCTLRQAPERERGWYLGGWREPYDGQLLGLREHAERLAQHYAQQPAVLGYQLIDNAPPGPTGHTLQHVHGELARVVRLRAPHQLLVSAAAMDPSMRPQAVDAWRQANAIALLDVLSVEDLAWPDTALPLPLMGATVAARLLGRPLWVGAAGVPVRGYAPRQRAQLVADKVAAAAHVGVAGYFHYSGISRLPEAQAFSIALGEPLGRTLPYLAANEWAAVPGCQPSHSCPASPPRVAEPTGVR